MTDQTADRLSASDVGVLAACVLGIATSCIAYATYAIGPFVIPLTREFGWSREQVMTGVSIVTAVTFFSSFLIGWIADTTPPKWLVVPSQIGLGLSYLALAMFTNGDIKVFFALYFLLGVVAAGTLPIVFNRVVATRFVRKRGTAIGIMLTGSGICGISLPPFLAWMIEHYGWRVALAAAGCIPIIVALLFSLVLLPGRAAPADPERAAVAQEGLTLVEAMQSWKFWVLGVSFFIGGGLSTGVVSNLVPLLRDTGMAPVTAAGAMSVFGLAVIVGRLVIGALADRFWAPPVAFAAMAPAALALLYLATQPLTTTTAYVCAFVLGLAAGAEADMLSYLNVRYFGARQAARIYAVMFVFFTVGIGVAGPIWGRVYDIYHTYNPILFGAAGAWIFCGLLFMTLGRYPDFSTPKAAA